jgi:hypothetical protein
MNNNNQSEMNNNNNQPEMNNNNNNNQPEMNNNNNQPEMNNNNHQMEMNNNNQYTNNNIEMEVIDVGKKESNELEGHQPNGLFESAFASVNETDSMNSVEGFTW